MHVKHYFYSANTRAPRLALKKQITDEGGGVRGSDHWSAVAWGCGGTDGAAVAGEGDLGVLGTPGADLR